jgi:beta-lactamase class A
VYAATLCLVLTAGLPASPPDWGDLLESWADRHKGRVAVAVKNLDTGDAWYYHADDVMPTASLIKVAVLFEAYAQADEGKIDLKERLTLHDDDKVPGSGILREDFSDGATFTLRDAVRLMIAFSDNTATNLVLGRVGLRAVNQRMDAWGFPNTRVHHLSFRGETTSIAPERTRRYGLGSTTAREAMRLFEELQTGTRHRPAVKQALLSHLRRNTDRDKFPRLLPHGTPLWHKDGANETIRTDAGLMLTPAGLVALCVLTEDNEDRRWHPDNDGNLLCARIARAVYNHFTPR